MENSNLNLAHYHGRRAENHFKHFRFDKALENYEMAANYIEEAIKTVTSPNILVSLKLQLKEHIRLINVVHLRKICLDKYIKELERQREADLLSKKRRSPCNLGGTQSGTPEHGGSEPSPKRSSDGSILDTPTSSILELDMQESSIMALAPLELPPLLDFESFRFNRTEANDL